MNPPQNLNLPDLLLVKYSFICASSKNISLALTWTKSEQEWIINAWSPHSYRTYFVEKVMLTQRGWDLKFPYHMILPFSCSHLGEIPVHPGWAEPRVWQRHKYYQQRTVAPVADNVPFTHIQNWNELAFGSLRVASDWRSCRFSTMLNSIFIKVQNEGQGMIRGIHLARSAVRLPLEKGFWQLTQTHDSKSAVHCTRIAVAEAGKVCSWLPYTSSSQAVPRGHQKTVETLNSQLQYSNHGFWHTNNSLLTCGTSQGLHRNC